jgi:CubicO group peptidase (beta-lactamase class C family)
MKSVLLFLALALPLAARDIAPSRELPVSKPEQVGMSAEKLAEIGPTVGKLIKRRKLAGASVIVLRKGHVVYREDFGMRDRGRKSPAEDDTIFRIYSMSKAITSTAIMMLAERGKLGLDDPVHKFIPELKGTKVWTKEGEVAAQRAPTVRDLLRHTAGYGYGWGNHPVDALAKKADLLNRNITLEEMGRRAGSVPLRFQPGTQWMYGINTDMLGRIVEVASGQDFGTFLKKNLFDPLDMKDTGFHVPEANKDRFSVVYGGGGLLVPTEKIERSPFLKKPKFQSGGGGLVSTIRDYARFLQMIAKRGEFQGRRYLKEPSVALMTTNQLPKEIKAISFGKEVRHGVGFGLGFAVRTADTAWDPHARLGEFGWGGMASTHYWVSPRDELVVVTMEQTVPYSWTLERALKPIIYDAIVK